MSHPALADAARTMLDSDAASTSVGIRVDRARDGDAVAHMPVTDRMVNGHGIAHGGYLFLLADTAFACACNSHGPGIHPKAVKWWPSSAAGAAPSRQSQGSPES